MLQAVLAAVCLAGARLAEPGEFTLRAFLAGRIDLTQAEAVLGVIDAGGADDLDTALVQLAGGLARPLHQLREDLLQLLAELEAGLDFVEEDIRFVNRNELLQRLQSAGELLEGISRQMESRHVATDLQQITLVGPPNVGKSSLFNALINRYGVHGGGPLTSPALVSPHRGTTRDYLTATISLDGMQCELVDTAGVDDNPHPTTAIDNTAQAFAYERRQKAAIRACCFAVPDLAPNNPANFLASQFNTDCYLVVLTKSDLATRDMDRLDLKPDIPTVVTSSKTGAGLSDFADAVRKLLARDTARTCHVVSVTADRCNESMRLAASAVSAGSDLVSQHAGDELVASELRVALAELGKVVGAVYTDDLLDRIFKTFCIGK
jgi:tRNA modification GTPase